MSAYILVVESNAERAGALCQLLKEKAGYTPVHVPTTMGALRELQSRSFALIATNTTLQRDRDGLKLIQLVLVEKKLTRGAPVLVISAEKDPAVVQQCVQAGVADYIVYPFNSEALVQRVDKVARRSESLSERLVYIATSYLGPVARLFLERQTRSRMNNLELDQLRLEHLPELFYWILLSVTPVLKEKSAEFIHRLETTFNVKRRR